MKIDDTNIAAKDTPYLIAEIGVNHFDIAEQRDIDPIKAAKMMITEAADVGVDAVKFQSYTAETLASKHSPAYWDTSEEETESQYELFAKYDAFGADEFEEIASWTTDMHDVAFLSTPFYPHAVDYLEDLVPAYKIASADVTNHPLLRQIARRGKPILLSTGASTIGEIDAAVRVIQDETPNVDLALLHCILQYPTDKSNANLGMIDHLTRVYPDLTIGYSDHVSPDDGMVTLLNSMHHGAQIIEKHFTLDKTLPGNDHYHAMDPADVRTFRQNAALVTTTTGRSFKKPIAAETDSRKHARRSVVAVRELSVGDTITRNDIAIKRPGTGISPTHLDAVIGRTIRSDISADEILRWEHF